MPWGIVLLIVLATTTLFQVLQQGAEARRRHRELETRLDRLERMLARPDAVGEDATRSLRAYETPDSMD